MSFVPLNVLLVILSTGGAGSAATPYDELVPHELEALGAEASRWIEELNERHRPHARRLTPAERAAFWEFFPAELLERARVRLVPGIANPEFFTSFFIDRGQPLPIDFRQASGLALVDTILVAAPRVAPGSPGWLPLLFHELVHLAQVEVLGEDEHVSAYVRNWARHGFRYRTIPQEEQAFALTARFRVAPQRFFSVAAEVERRFGGDGPEPLADR